MDHISDFKLPRFPIQDSELQLQRTIVPTTYCESVGQQSAILGFERGIFEVWVYPFKILSDLQFSVALPAYNMVVQGSIIARQIVVRPELTTLIYSHDLFTMRQHLLAPIAAGGVIILFEIDCCTPLELWLSFQPNLVPMWPAGLGGQYTLWLEEIQSYYIGEGTKRYAGIIGSPGARKLSTTPGHQLPDEPMKMVVSISPEQAADVFLPIVITGSSQGKEDALKQYHHLLSTIPEQYQESISYYRRLASRSLSVTTPSAEINQALQWARLSLDKGLVANPQLGKGLVAGYGVSGKTHRPGFAWFFGGDSCYNALAIICYGHFELARIALTLLRSHQRSDGKIPHELTQSAALLNWFDDYPYGFYHAETTAFYIVAMTDYLQRSGDLEFIRSSWPSLKKAYQYCLSADEDGDGLMENSAAGLAAMEVGALLQRNRVDVYLATVWLQALRCLVRLADVFGDRDFQQQCLAQYEKGYQSFLKIFVNDARQELAFAQLIDGTLHRETTVWQALPLFFQLIEAERVSSTVQELASAAMTTDWGLRGVSQQSSHYDPISYNTGAVWPFTTGFVATAQYRHHQSIQGWHNLLANARMTWLDALGWQTELLSGEFYRPVTTSVPHQLFSAAGIINPLVLGLLGLESDALRREIHFSPHLPFDWQELQVGNYRCGEDQFNFALCRTRQSLKLELHHHGAAVYRFTFSPAFAPGTTIERVLVNQRGHDFRCHSSRFDVHCEVNSELVDRLEIQIDYHPGIEFDISLPPLEIGDRSSALKLIDYKLEEKKLTLQVEGRCGREYQLPIRSGQPIIRAEGGELQSIAEGEWRLIFKFNGKIADHRYEQKTLQLYLS